MKKIMIIIAAMSACLGLLPSCVQEEGLEESQLIYFSITEPYARIGGVACTVDNVNLTVTNVDPIPADIDLTSVKPYFVLNHPGQGVFVKGAEQKSGESRQDLSVPVVYEVKSARGTLKYTVTLTKSETVQTQAGVILTGHTDLAAEITAEREVWLDPGVRFSEVDFTAADDGRPLRLDIFEVDLGREDITLYPLTPDNISDVPAEGATWPVQTIPAQAAAAEAAGVKVLGAVNADFYDIGATNAPEGPICRNGKMLKDTFLGGDDHYFGIRDDKRASVGGESAFSQLYDKFTFAIGGRQVLLKASAPTDGIKNDEPRSHRVGIGTNALDHLKVVIACIEGRNGSAASVRMVEMAYVLKAFGADEALNLDGGGSATFVVKEDGAWKAVNRPDGDLRPVVDGLAIIKK